MFFGSLDDQPDGNFPTSSFSKFKVSSGSADRFPAQKNRTRNSRSDIKPPDP
jgi:hypothetical protein